MNRIVGIVLVKDEDHFISWAIENVAAFCDEILVLDNHSTDGTPAQLAALTERFAHIRVESIDDPNRSHRYIEEYAGTSTWVFGVDGDEIYDPEGLARFRPRVVNGEFDAWWKIGGHMLNPVQVDLKERTATGYATPSTPSVTKLYNFGALESWVEPARQRLHGDSMVFRPGWSKGKILKLYRDETWDSCDFRCLHLCFFPRSSRVSASPVERKNPSQVKADRPRRILERVKTFLRHPFLPDPGYKTRRYRRGPLVTRGVSAFGPPGGELLAKRGETAAARVLAGRGSTHGPARTSRDPRRAHGPLTEPRGAQE